MNDRRVDGRNAAGDRLREGQIQRGSFPGKTRPRGADTTAPWAGPVHGAVVSELRFQIHAVEKIINPHFKDVRQLDEFLDAQKGLLLFQALHVQLGFESFSPQNFAERHLRHSAPFTQMLDSFPYGHVVSPLSPCVHATEQTWTDVVACLLLL